MAGSPFCLWNSCSNCQVVNTDPWALSRCSTLEVQLGNRQDGKFSGWFPQGMTLRGLKWSPDHSSTMLFILVSSEPLPASPSLISLLFWGPCHSACPGLPASQCPKPQQKASPHPPVCMGSEFWWVIITSSKYAKSAALCPQASQRKPPIASSHSQLHNKVGEIHQLKGTPTTQGSLPVLQKPSHSADSDKSGPLSQSLREMQYQPSVPGEKMQHQGWCPASATWAYKAGTWGRPAPTCPWIHQMKSLSCSEWRRWGGQAGALQWGPGGSCSGHVSQACRLG